MRILPSKTIVVLMAVWWSLSACQTMQPGGASPNGADGMGTPANPGAGDVYVQLAAAYMRQGKPIVAVQKAKQAIQVEPTNGDAYNILALLYDQLGEAAQAEKHHQQALRLRPNNSYFSNAYGVYLCKQKRFDEADAQFEKALDNPLYPTPEVAQTNAGICAIEHKKPQQAERYFRSALQRNKRFAVALFQMAKMRFQAGDMATTKDYLRRFHEASQPTPQSLWLSIRTERRLKNTKAAASYEMMLKKRFPDSQEVMLLRRGG